MNGLKGWIVLACIALATGQAMAQERKSIVADGKQWMSASASERRAFLIGVGNMIAAEMAYAKKTGRETQTASALITKGVGDLKLPDIEARITRWYEANPGRLAMPVLGVVWQDLVKQKR